MKNILNMCEYMQKHSAWPDDFESEEIEMIGSDLEYYYLLSKRLEKQVEKLRTENAQLRQDSEVLHAM